MKARTALRLARPASAADRARCVLVACSTVVAGALLLAAMHVLRMPADSGAGLARYVTESGLRPGVVIATLLLTVPVLALTVQALRVGSVARDRRLASLRLAGATPRDVRVIAALEAGGAAIAGGLLGGPVYLFVWLLAGALSPAGARMLHAPDAVDLLAWAVLLPLAGLAGAFAGAAVHGRAVVEPLGVRRRSRPPAPGRASLAVLMSGAALVVAVMVAVPLVEDHGDRLGLLILAMIGLLLAAFAGGPRLVLACARVLGRRRGAEALLASRHLRADPRSAGRVAGVLLVCGIALGFEGFLIADQTFSGGFGSGDDAAFFLTGYAMAALVVLTAAAVALVTLLVGAADGLLDARRPLSTLAALGAGEGVLVRVLARQLTATAVPAVVAGALIGGAPAGVLLGVASDGGHALDAAARALGPAAVAAVVAGLVLAAAARLAARLLRPLIRAAIDPENLRAA